MCGWCPARDKAEVADSGLLPSVPRWPLAQPQRPSAPVSPPHCTVHHHPLTHQHMEPQPVLAASHQINPAVSHQPTHTQPTHPNSHVPLPPTSPLQPIILFHSTAYLPVLFPHPHLPVI